MRITKPGLIATAGFLILFAAGIIEAMLDGLDALPAAALAVYVVAIAIGVSLLLWSLSLKARIEAAEDIAARESKRRQAREAPPLPCELCYTNPARVRCTDHNLDICIECCNFHDSTFRCTLYLIPSVNEFMKARA